LSFQTAQIDCCFDCGIPCPDYDTSLARIVIGVLELVLDFVVDSHARTRAIKLDTAPGAEALALFAGTSATHAVSQCPRVGRKRQLYGFGRDTQLHRRAAVANGQYYPACGIAGGLAGFAFFGNHDKDIVATLDIDTALLLVDVEAGCFDLLLPGAQDVLLDLAGPRDRNAAPRHDRVWLEEHVFPGGVILYRAGDRILFEPEAPEVPLFGQNRRRKACGTHANDGDVIICTGRPPCLIQVLEDTVEHLCALVDGILDQRHARHVPDQVDPIDIGHEALVPRRYLA